MRACGEPIENVRENNVWSQPWYTPRKPHGDTNDFTYLEYSDGQPLIIASVSTPALVSAPPPPESKLRPLVNEYVPGHTPIENVSEILKRMVACNAPDNKFGDKKIEAYISGNLEVFASDYPPNKPGEPCDRSRADAWFLSHLYFWCGGNGVKMAAAMKSTGSYRPKHDSETYMCRSINKIIDDRKVSNAPVYGQSDTRIINTLSWSEITTGLKATLDNDDLLNAAIIYIALQPAIKRGALKNELKKIADISIQDINAALRENMPPIKTHGEIVEDYIDKFPTQPVGEMGKVYIYNEPAGTYTGHELNIVGVDVSKKYKDEPRCVKGSYYSALAKHIYNSTYVKDYFRNGPKGVNVKSVFLYIDGVEIKHRSKSPDNRALFALDVEPDRINLPPLFFQFLREALESDDQIFLLQQLFGAALFGLQSELQKAVFLIGPGGSGKSTFLRIMEALIPPEFVASVAPQDLDKEYAKASLAGKRFNIVPEISKDKPVPSAAFKSLTGQDIISAREPYGMPFTFVSEAACWFNGNFYPVTTDHSSGWWRRWVTIHFKHAKPEYERDSTLYERIITTELAQILGWAVNGAQALIRNNMKLTYSAAHFECLADWKRSSNTVESWLYDDVLITCSPHDLKPIERLRKTEAYDCYKNWCFHARRNSLGITNFYKAMEELGHTAIGGERGYPRLSKFGKLHAV